MTALTVWESSANLRRNIQIAGCIESARRIMGRLMAEHIAREHEHWSSKFAFIMAAVGSSVGLGNLWRFSSEAGTNGGGAFILIYFICVLFIGIPILLSEYVIGRASNQASAVRSVEDLAAASGGSKGWSVLAWIGMAGAYMVVGFYIVVAGWVLAYIPKFLGGTFEGLSDPEIANQFVVLIGDKQTVMMYSAIFLVATIFLVARGVNKGIELAAKLLMPVFFVLLVVLCIYALIIGDAGAALTWMYSPDFSAIGPQVVVSALGQAFFSIGIGSAIMITYGSYLPQGISIPTSATQVALVDTGVAVIAGMAIFPMVFAIGLDPAGGAGLFFQTLPVALHSAPGGAFIGAAFFVLAFFAAVTSSISLLEVSTAWFIDKTRLPRPLAAIILGAGVGLLGFLCIMTFGESYPFLADRDVFTLLDDVSGTILLPLSGLFVALFVGWRLDAKTRDAELEGMPAALKGVLMLFLRFVVPIAVAIILVVGTWERWLPASYASVFGG